MVALAPALAERAPPPRLIDDMRKLLQRDWVALGIIAAGAITLPMVYFVRELVIAGTAGFPLDDSWIHLVFARNIARGDFFAYNAHEPVAGSTSPLWSVVLGLGFALTHSPVIMPKVLGALLNVALGIVVFRFAEFLKMTRASAVITGLLVVCAPRMVWASLSGMDVSLYSVLALASSYYYIRYLTATSWRGYLGWIFGGISVMARPELLLTAGFFLLHHIILQHQRPPLWQPAGASHEAAVDRAALPSPIALLLRVAVFCACSVPFFALNLFLSGSLFPVTFLAKAAPNGAWRLLTQGEYAEVLRRLVVAFWMAPRNAFCWIWAQDNLYLAIVSVFACVFVVILAAKRSITTVPLSALLLVALQLFFFPFIRSLVAGRLDFGAWGRYAAQTTPLVVLIGALSVTEWLERWVHSAANPRALIVGFVPLATLLLGGYYSLPAVFGRGHQWPSADWYPAWMHQGSAYYVILFGGVAGIVSIGGLVLTRRRVSTTAIAGVVLFEIAAFTAVENLQAADEYAWNVRNINDAEVFLGKWIETNVSKNAVYATNDIGAMAYFADGVRQIDLIGVTNPEVARLLAENHSKDETAAWIVRTWRPAYVICFNEWYPVFLRDGLESGLLERVKSVSILNNVTCGGKGVVAMHVYAVNRDRLDRFSSLGR